MKKYTTPSMLMLIDVADVITVSYDIEEVGEVSRMSWDEFKKASDVSDESGHGL